MTIGAYDGVHLGHRALLGRTGRAGPGRRADHRGGDLRPPSGHVVRPESAPTAPVRPRSEARTAGGGRRGSHGGGPLRRGAGQRDGRGVRGRRCWWSGLGARLVVVGEDFHFGHGRKGNVALLARDGRDRPASRWTGCRCGPTGGDGGPGEPISSTRIRSLVAEGRVEEAAVLLGRPHQVRGAVAHGDRRGGTELGFPTANVAVPDGICLPATGIYAGWYERPDGSTVAGGHLGGTATHLLRGRRRACWWRPTCSTSPATSTARRPGCRSSPTCGTRWPSTRSTRWSPRCGRDVAATRELLVPGT